MPARFWKRKKLYISSSTDGREWFFLRGTGHPLVPKVKPKDIREVPSAGAKAALFRQMGIVDVLRWTVTAILLAIVFTNMFFPKILHIFVSEHAYNQLTQSYVFFGWVLIWVEAEHLWLKWQTRAWRQLQEGEPLPEWVVIPQSPVTANQHYGSLVFLVLFLLLAGIYQLYWLPQHADRFGNFLPLVFTGPVSVLLTALMLKPGIFRYPQPSFGTSVLLEEGEKHKRRLWLSLALWCMLGFLAAVAFRGR